mgnify:CR=1 FL=1
MGRGHVRFRTQGVTGVATVEAAAPPRAIRPAAWAAVAAAWLTLASAAPASAQSSQDAEPPSRSIEIVGVQPPTPAGDGRLHYPVPSVDGGVSVDGRLDEPAWESAVVVPLPWEVDPGDNSAAPVETECRLAFDADNLYLGCTALDPDPERIRAYIVDRDRIDGHDRITLTLDPFNDQRRAFQFGVSALGVQSDAVLSQSGGNPNQPQDAQPIDPSWDAIWSSAGAITPSGFVVEAAIPFRSLRFPSSDGEQSWGAYFTRWWPRGNNVEIRSATWDRDDACTLCQANLVTGIAGGAQGANVQLTPTFTSARTQNRPDDGGGLETDPVTGEVGLDAQWGITSNLTLNLTANPDFSQVEADVAQLDVNNRFALFFPERRPFFMEGADFFETPIRAVFTRSIVDPVGGAKVTGKLGGSAVGLLVARDRTNQILIPGSQSSEAATLDDGPVTAIARFRRDIGGASTLGVLYTGREGDGYANRVGGVDAFWRPAGSVTLQAQLMRSSTAYPDSIAGDFGQPTGTFEGNAAVLRGTWSTRSWRVSGNVRGIDPGFRADAGFVTQAGVRGGNVDVARTWWGGSRGWFTQLRLETGTWHNRDVDGNQINGGIWAGLNYRGPGQLSIGIWPNLFMKEYLAGTTYEGMSQLWFDVRAAPAGWWSAGVNGNVGDALDFANERLGSETRLSPDLSLRIGRNVEASVSHTWQRLSHGGDRVFTANLTQLRTVYSFSPRSFVRALVQYRRTDRDPGVYVDTVDRRAERTVLQLLYAYKLNPQTVFFLGYSENGEGAVDPDRRRTPLTVQGRTLFLKLGYALRL